MPERYWLGVGLSAGFVVASFFIAGLHHELKWRLKQRRYGGWL